MSGHQCRIVVRSRLAAGSREAVAVWELPTERSQMPDVRGAKGTGSVNSGVRCAASIAVAKVAEGGVQCCGHVSWSRSGRYGGNKWQTDLMERWFDGEVPSRNGCTGTCAAPSLRVHTDLAGHGTAVVPGASVILRRRGPSSRRSGCALNTGASRLGWPVSLPLGPAASYCVGIDADIGIGLRWRVAVPAAPAGRRRPATGTPVRASRRRRPTGPSGSPPSRSGSAG